jgi:GH15 family glucan-1,4-alpha-glucosidase
LTRPRLEVLYDVYGRPPAKESAVKGLSGYQNAGPVRTGNGADGQVQLDSYGEVIEAVWRVTRAGHGLSRAACDVLESFGRYVCKHWHDGDAGIWEPRGEPIQHTHSLLLCWAALDRLIDLQDHGDMRKRHRTLFSTTRDEIRSQIDQHGYNADLGAYVSVLDGDSLDATALMIGWYGFESPASERMRSTYRLLMAELSPGAGLLFRNKSDGDDGAFGICSFWLSEHLAQGGGTLAEACAAFEATLSYGNTVGIFSEQIEPATGRALGNVPQTFTHVGLINAALSIAEREKREGG